MQVVGIFAELLHKNWQLLKIILLCLSENDISKFSRTTINSLSKTKVTDTKNECQFAISFEMCHIMKKELSVRAQ